jgi:hypothetical protein
MESRPLDVIRDIGHDGWLCTFIIKQQIEMPSARSWAAPARQGRRYGLARQAVRTVHHSKQITPAGPLSPS